MKNLRKFFDITRVEKQLAILIAMGATGSLAVAGPVSDAAGAIDMGDVLTGVGLAGVAVIGIVVAIKGIKYLKSAL